MVGNKFKMKIMIPYTPPTFKSKAYNCPHCNAFANQNWYDSYSQSGSSATLNKIANFEIVVCSHCKNYSYWHKGALIYPDATEAPLPNVDLPEELKADYNEARTILNKSPRGAAALLRLCIQKLCKHLGESGRDINKDIGNLVKKGLSTKIQKSLDIVRVIGNDAVHPGQIDLTDDIETARKLFLLVNIIADAMITQPKEIDQLFDSLPENKLDAIKDRDKKV